MSEKIFTWKELKEFCNQLSEHQLQQTVKYWGEGVSGNVLQAEVLDDNWRDFGADCLESDELYKQGDTEEDWEDTPIIHPKGTVMLDVESR